MPFTYAPVQGPVKGPPIARFDAPVTATNATARDFVRVARVARRGQSERSGDNPTRVDAHRRVFFS